ncbi:MAG: hypothetical protein KGZ83_20445 [Sulfuricella sp.]|nr:hypothetical protein [Sulfuricella sp.]
MLSLYRLGLVGLVAFLGSASPSLAFQFSADEFKGVLNGTSTFLDPFDGSTTPPAAPKFLTSVALTPKYNLGGTFTTPGAGKLLFSSAQAIVSPANTSYLVNKLTLSATNSTGATTNLLQPGATFEVSAIFDLIMPQKNDEGYCLELGDWQSNPKNDPTLWAKEVARLCIYKNTDNNNVNIRFNQKDVTTGIAKLFSKTPIEAGHQQIQFKLAKTDQNLNAITASYAYVDGGVVGKDTAVPGTANVFTYKQYTIPALHSFTPVGTADASGMNTKYSVQAHLEVAGDALGKTGNLYVVVVIPSGGIYMHDGTTWVLWKGGTMPAYAINVALKSQDIAVLKDLDVSAFTGTQIYVGYGASDAEMLDNGTYSLINTIP